MAASALDFNARRKVAGIVLKSDLQEAAFNLRGKFDIRKFCGMPSSLKRFTGFLSGCMKTEPREKETLQMIG